MNKPQQAPGAAVARVELDDFLQVHDRPRQGAHVKVDDRQAAMGIDMVGPVGQHELEGVPGIVELLQVDVTLAKQGHGLQPEVALVADAGKLGLRLAQPRGRALQVVDVGVGFALAEKRLALQ